MYAFIIIILVNDDEPILACRLGGHMPMLAEYLDMDSHHPEAAALFAAHTFLGSFLLDYPRPIGPLSENSRLRFVLDNRSVTTDIEWTFDINTSPFDYLKADYNIIQAIQEQNRKLPLELCVSWVKGHQDRDKMWGELTSAAKANVYADKTCDETHDRPVLQSAVFPTQVPGTKATLLHKGRPVTKKIEQYTSIAATADRHKPHIIARS